MRAVLIILLSFAAYIASAVPIDDQNAKRPYSRFIKFPDGEGNYHDVDLEALPDLNFLAEIARNPEENQYLLFTRQNPSSSQELIINNIDSIRDSNFNPNVPTVVVAHGWRSNADTIVNPLIRDAFLQKSDVNVIILDWHRLALADYTTAVRGVPEVGRGLGRFIKFLCESTGATLSDFHIVGHSLGAHVVGNTGKELEGKAARVTGLDPAGPLWLTNSNRLSSNDAVYVEAIHTDGSIGGLGIGTAIAHADFYPNGGLSQPGCDTSLCHHIRAFELFAATVTYNHLIGNQCSSTLQVTTDTCQGDHLHMGNDDLKKFGVGMYRVNTGSSYPY